MTTAAQLRYSAKYRRANLAREAARARRYADEHFGEAVGCAYWWCRNRTRHESGLCWRHRARRKASL